MLLNSNESVFEKQAYGNTGNFFKRDILLTLAVHWWSTNTCSLAYWFVWCTLSFKKVPHYILKFVERLLFWFCSPPACLPPPHDQPILKAILLGLRGKYHKLIILDITLSSIRLHFTLSSCGMRTLSWNSGDTVRSL